MVRHEMRGRLGDGRAKRRELSGMGGSVELANDADGVPLAELGGMKPYTTIPTLIDRELILYESRVMVEDLDGRLPHPP